MRSCSLENLQLRFTMKSAVLDELYCPVRPLVQSTILKFSTFLCVALRWGGRAENFWRSRTFYHFELLSQNGDEGPTSKGGEGKRMDDGAGTRHPPSPRSAARGTQRPP